MNEFGLTPREGGVPHPLEQAQAVLDAAPVTPDDMAEHVGQAALPPALAAELVVHDALGEHRHFRGWEHQFTHLDVPGSPDRAAVAMINMDTGTPLPYAGPVRPYEAPRHVKGVSNPNDPRFSL